MGNLLQSRKINDPASTYLWGYQQILPIAKIENATYEQVRDALGGQTAVDAIMQSATLSQAQLDQLKGLKQSLSNSMVTIYTYEPLKGLTSQTDPAGVTTYYEYDEFNRLKLIRDQDKKIVKSYFYRYKQ